MNRELDTIGRKRDDFAGEERRDGEARRDVESRIDRGRER